MIGALITIIFCVAYLSGLLYTAPIFAMEEARRRGRAHVHYDDAAHGVVRSIAWPFLGLITYTQKVADVKLGKLPDVSYARALEASNRSHELSRAMDKELENHEKENS